MKLIESTLYLEFAEMVECGVNSNTLLKAKERDSSSWHFINDPKDQRKVLIGYDALRDNYKKQIIDRFGDPYDYIAKAPIRKLLKTDFKAEQFYKDYRYGTNNESFLPIEHRNKYTVAASWLNLLIELNSDKKFIKKELNLSLIQFWDNVCKIIKTDNIELPTTYQRLTNKMKEYQQESYGCIIDWRFGNKLSAKIGKGEAGYDPQLADKQIAFIRSAASKHQNFDAMQIASAVNMVFAKQNWPCISHGTVYNLIKENEHLTLAGSRGKREYSNKIAMQLTRKASEFPLYYLTLDGWTAELLYQDKNTFHNRLVVVVVLDACTKYPVGYAIGERENTELIRQANRNTSQHIKELFGAYYQPRQLQSDRYGLKNLTPFYQSMAHLHTPAAAGNAKSKIIEPYFMYLNKHYCQRFSNWYGFNITASKTNQPNTEYLDKIKHSFPDKDGVISQINMIMQQERKVKINEYLQKWEAMPEADKLLLKKEDLLMVFGKPTGFMNSITGQGLMPTIEGQTMVYDSFDPRFRSLQHLRWQPIYDKDDLSSILVISECQKHKFVLDQKRVLPMDIHSMNADDHKYLGDVRNYNADRRDEIMQTYASDAAKVDDVIKTTPFNLDDYDEAALKLMFTYGGQQKERLQDAKGLKQLVARQDKQDAIEQKNEASQWQRQQQEYLQSKTDFNQYLD